MDFHNPYQFVPFVRGVRNDVTRADFDAGKPARVTHDRYVAGTHSGRLLCRITTESPIFIGSKRHDHDPPTRVNNYRLGGELAIPASSLRGLVSSLAEAASNSALRVLDSRRSYSYRKPLDPSAVLSAVGMVMKAADGRFYLKPLAIPTLKARNGIAELPQDYRPLFPEPLMKVHIGNRRTITSDTFPYRTFSPSKPLWYALPLEPRHWLQGFRLQDDPHQKRKGRDRQFVIGQLSVQPGLDPVLNEAVRTQIPEALHPKCVLGVVRVLGCWGNRTQSMPKDKTHELFLPWPESEKWPMVPLADEVVDRFQKLCQERTQQSQKAFERDRDNPLLPFEPLDTRPGRTGQITLEHGDIVYFRAGRGGEIKEISFSSIWRDWVNGSTGRPATCSQFFPAELMPFDEHKQELTTGDLLFGFVEDREKEDREKTDRKSDPIQAKPALALASRVKFSHASIVANKGRECLDEVVLKILDGPKPPCPSMYFRSRNLPGYIPKRDLNPVNHEAQGRKYYLHHRERDGKAWESDPNPNKHKEHKEQKSRVRPIDVGNVFYFHVDFDNLDEQELGLLIYALRPSDGFRHKIGMGKAIGLGSIRIDPLAWLQVDRVSRYSEQGLKSARYTRAALAANENSADWPDPYRSGPSLPGPDGLFDYRDRFAAGMNAEIRRAIEMVGDRNLLRAPVCPPLLIGQPPEEETFKWFMENDRAETTRQFLQPLGNTKTLPVLKKMTPGEPRR